jgi:predicted ATPase
LLCADKERMLLARLSVFRGWTLEAMESVCSGDGIERSEMQDLLSALIRDALVVFESREKESRYRQLEIIRQFSQEKLSQSGEAGTFHQRHLTYFLDLAEQTEPELMLEGERLQELHREHDNLTAALDFAIATDNNWQAALRLMGALPRFWALCGFLKEGSVYFKKVLSRDNQATPQPILAKVLYGAGLVAWYQFAVREAHDYFQRCLPIYQAIRERRGEADTLNYLGNLARLSQLGLFKKHKLLI